MVSAATPELLGRTSAVERALAKNGSESEATRAQPTKVAKESRPRDNLLEAQIVGRRGRVQRSRSVIKRATAIGKQVGQLADFVDVWKGCDDFSKLPTVVRREDDVLIKISSKGCTVEKSRPAVNGRHLRSEAEARQPRGR